MTKPEAAVKWAINTANDQRHGYSQQSRWGNPDYDCSSFAISAYKAVGVPIDTNKVSYTGNMQGLTNYGFRDVTSKVNLNTGNGLQPGDILLSVNGEKIVSETDLLKAQYEDTGTYDLLVSRNGEQTELHLSIEKESEVPE